MLVLKTLSGALILGFLEKSLFCVIQAPVGGQKSVVLGKKVRAGCQSRSGQIPSVSVCPSCRGAPCAPCPGQGSREKTGVGYQAQPVLCCFWNGGWELIFSDYTLDT